MRLRIEFPKAGDTKLSTDQNVKRGQTIHQKLYTSTTSSCYEALLEAFLSSPAGIRYENRTVKEFRNYLRTATGQPNIG